MHRFIIEIATTDFETTRNAIEGGADRIELCANLNEGGTTPSKGMIEQCRKIFNVPLFPIIRPRGGDFLYTEDEFQIMVQDIRYCKDVGCEGVVTGVLDHDGNIDLRRMEMLINAAYPMDITFHRSFDRCNDPFKALEELINLGCQRILTSGQQPAAPEGKDLIRDLITAADKRIIIMPGSGVRKENIKELADHTNATEFHSSLRSQVKSQMRFIHPAFEVADSNFNSYIDPQEVTALRAALNS